MAKKDGDPCIDKRRGRPEFGPARGCLWAIGPSLLLWALAIVFVVRACRG